MPIIYENLCEARGDGAVSQSTVYLVCNHLSEEKQLMEDKKHPSCPTARINYTTIIIVATCNTTGYKDWWKMAQEMKGESKYTKNNNMPHFSQPSVPAHILNATQKLCTYWSLPATPSCSLQMWGKLVFIPNNNFWWNLDAWLRIKFIISQ